MLEPERILPHAIAARASEDPGNVALQDVDGREVTYGEFHTANLTWADALRRRGVAAGDTVLTMFPNQFESFYAWMAVAWLRALEVPLNTAYSEKMLGYLVANSRAKLFVCSERYLDQVATVDPSIRGDLEAIVVPDLSGAAPDLGVPVVGGEEFFADATPATDLDGPAHHDIACIIYTSGTTGPSKGVLVPWAELHQFPAATPPGVLRKGSGFYACLPTFHVGGKSLVYLTSLGGARAVLREVFSLTEFWNDIRRFDCATTGLVGVMAQFLLSMPESDDDADNPLTVIQTGPLFPEVDDFERRFGLKIFTGYGMTEVGAPIYGDPDHRVDWRSCGKARDRYEIRIVDEYDEQVPVGDVGELIIRSHEPWELNVGYWGMPEKTAEAWRNGWFHTGDGFRVDEDGNYYFVDRLKDAMRKGGENISSLEVEGHVREHPGVLEVAAIAAPSEFGPGEDEVKVLVVRHEGQGFSEAELLEYLKPTMAKFMFPRYVEFVDELPKTPTQRIQKVLLRDGALNDRTWDGKVGGYVTAS
ncbi:MAG: AMP-binding protein [Acidimicrobiia bacterium]